MDVNGKWESNNYSLKYCSKIFCKGSVTKEVDEINVIKS